MSIFLIKSLLSVPLVFFALLAMFTMFEIFGRSERKFSIDRMRLLHSISGVLFIILFIAISYFCIAYVARTQTELSARGTVHAILSLAVAVLLFIKILFVRQYRQFYSHAKVLGIVVTVLSLLMSGSSAGYYLLAGGAVENRMGMQQQGIAARFGVASGKWAVRADERSIRLGRELFESKCAVCHDPLSAQTRVGPGLKGILRNGFLPVSKRPATPENISNQLRNPFSKMPSFAYLTDDEVRDITAYLNTL